MVAWASLKDCSLLKFPVCEQSQIGRCDGAQRVLLLLPSPGGGGQHGGVVVGAIDRK